MAIGLLALGTVLDLARHIPRLGPVVGDIVAFTPTEARLMDANARIAATRADGSRCTLDAAVMRKTGGSLVVEERHPGLPRTYRAHWSGLRSAADGSDCGSAADLTLRVDDLAALAVAAGGWGVPRQRSGLFASWSGANSVPR
jgi:hypothetical protein